MPRYPQNLTFVVAIELFYFLRNLCTYPISKPLLGDTDNKKLQRKDDECFKHILGVLDLVNIILVYGRSIKQSMTGVQEILVNVRRDRSQIQQV